MAKDTEQRHEDEWFRKHERALLLKARLQREKKFAELQAQRDSEGLEHLRLAHWMKCPKCGHEMETIKLRDVDVERCTFCQGIYFDRDELESLVLKKPKRRRKLFRRLLGLRSKKNK